MKYMGSKSVLLRGALGELLLQEANKAQQFFDLFSGSGAVSHYVSENVAVSVQSVDLQRFSVPLALSITGRTKAVDDAVLVNDWIKKAVERYESADELDKLRRASRRPSKTSVKEARAVSKGLSSGAVNKITQHYGGHYFSPIQAFALDILWATRPSGGELQKLAEACVLRTASRCAAAPGHTAQPFQPTESLVPFLRTAWALDVFHECESQVRMLAPRHAIRVGDAREADAVEQTARIKPGDLVFCDPPYSAVQYSRFYHVLEGICRGGWDEVGGAGRAPSRLNRASSSFSMVSEARQAFAALLQRLSDRGATVVLTFPAEVTSLNVSGSDIATLASEHFAVEKTYIDHVHSSLGGPSPAPELPTAGRTARRKLHEMALLMRPRSG